MPVDPGALLHDLLVAGIAHCRAAVVEHGGVIGSLFVAGLLGGVTHCAGMCGPFVLAQSVARLEATPAVRMSEFGRLADAALIPYQLGRITTYTALGAVGAAIAQGTIVATDFRPIAAMLLLVAALAFALYALRRIGIAFAWRRGSAGGESAAAVGLGHLVRPLMADPRGLRGFALGLALGFLPCGLLYGALAAAASAGDALAGALAMLAFAAGTVPALIAIALAGQVAGRQWRGLAARVAPALLMANAGVLTYLAWRVAG